MERNGVSVALIYGDREHFANLHFFTNFDPRFEEALLVVNFHSKPLLLVGNECQSYLPISPLFKAGELRAELYPHFSLEDQHRPVHRSLDAILREEGCVDQSKVALIGSKTYPDPRHSDIPSYIVDTARDLADCINHTAWLVHAEHGLRTTLSAADIAIFEINNVKAGEAMRRMHYNLRPGITDHVLMAESIEYDGTPLSCHMTCKTGPNRVSLASASGNLIERGHTWSSNVAYWGSNICRANWIAEGPQDLPVPAQDYLAVFVGPYFIAMASWLESFREGAHCGEIYDSIHQQLPHAMFHVDLNPGHHIGYDEWPSAPVYEGSSLRLASGMVLQSDVIPSHPVYFSTRMEEGYAIADQTLRNELARNHPQTWARIEARRAFLANQLNIHLHESALPLANTSGLIAPWGLSPRMVLARS